MQSNLAPRGEPGAPSQVLLNFKTVNDLYEAAGKHKDQCKALERAATSGPVPLISRLFNRLFHSSCGNR
jgi:hypothetical protein